MLTTMSNQPAISVQDLSFSYGGPSILSNVNLELPRGCRCLLVGANGAGKTTLLRILAGKRLVKDKVLILGKHAYFETPEGISYLGPEWVKNPVTARDLPVLQLLESHNANRHPERLRKLLAILEIDPTWHTHLISDGERRRVQILMGLLQPYDVLFLDEVTVDLDVLVRRDLLHFLKSETEERGCSIIYATHIFDGIGDWPSHIAHIRNGTIMGLHAFNNEFLKKELSLDEHGKPKNSFDSPLLMVVERWLREDFNLRIEERRRIGRTKWDELSEDARKYGDKYYNYWNHEL
ncbi:P-loop containing nucleoside triphosphate hydrolase protein [Paraphysoderma sedebokerense]|nr:P-loop containing nucleoside triphosphate hydrolase protein [Paraphysoderma sedebokerense]